MCAAWYWTKNATATLCQGNPAFSRIPLVSGSFDTCFNTLFTDLLQLIETLRKETKIQLRNLAVDGGVSQNNLICETISTLAQKQVNRPVDIEASARGATFFAGITAGIWDIDSLPTVDHKVPIAPSNQKDFDNLMSEYTCWKDSIKRTLKWHELELDEQDPSELCFKPELSNL